MSSAHLISLPSVRNAIRLQFGQCTLLADNETRLSVPSPSRTAEYMALFRALETVQPGDKRLFADPFAAGFLRPSLKLTFYLARIPFVGAGILKYLDYRWPGARTSGVARTRLIDDFVMESFGQGLAQVVILGSGFDSRPYRLKFPPVTRIFEVDQPGTLQAKERIMRRRLGAWPPSIAFVELDFNRQELGPLLQHAGFRHRQPALFIWEGVTNYLTEEAVDAMLRWISSSAPPSELIFTFVDRAVLGAANNFEGTQRLSRTLARAGERWTFGLDPSDLRHYLSLRGLDLLDDLGAAEYRTRCLGTPGVGYEFYHVARARVTGAGAARERSAVRGAKDSLESQRE
jgi:methyltransferase (TIGR00027 family)